MTTGSRSRKCIVAPKFETLCPVHLVDLARFFPIELISNSIGPCSSSIRLFGNMMTDEKD